MSKIGMWEEETFGLRQAVQSALRPYNEEMTRKTKHLHGNAKRCNHRLLQLRDYIFHLVSEVENQKPDPLEMSQIGIHDYRRFCRSQIDVMFYNMDRELAFLDKLIRFEVRN